MARFSNDHFFADLLNERQADLLFKLLDLH
jgi:hypothetical protein